MPVAPKRLWSLAFLAPLLAFGGIVAMLAVGLTLNPREIPSPLIGKPVPRFELPPVRGRTLGLASVDLKGEVSIVNVFRVVVRSVQGRAPRVHSDAA